MVDNYIEEHKDALRADDPDARRGRDDTVRSVGAVVDDPVEARLLAVQTEQRRQALLSDAETAYDSAAKAEVGEQRLDRAAEDTRQPDQADRRPGGWIRRPTRGRVRQHREPAPRRRRGNRAAGGRERRGSDNPV